MTGDNLQHTPEAVRRLSQTFFDIESVGTLVLIVTVSLLLGRLIAYLLRRLVVVIGGRADRSPNLQTVNRLRRYETYLVLSIAIIRTLLVLFGLYFWWLLNHPNQQPTALLGASAVLLIVISTSIGPLLRDIASGSAMMAEQWYGVGDHVRIEPFNDMQGVVERVTLRSTRIRGLNGEIMWVNNQHVQAIRITPKGIRTMALELFVTDLPAGIKLVADTNKRLPTGPLLLVSPLLVVETAEVGDKLWQITAVGETAPGREWLVEQSAVDLIKWLDEQLPAPVIAHGPLARYADAEAEKRFRRTITNARKSRAPKRRAANKRARRS